jgi:hypothetical protein
MLRAKGVTKNSNANPAGSTPSPAILPPLSFLFSFAFHGSRPQAEDARISAFRFATQRKTGIAVTPSKQTIGHFPVRNRSRDFELLNFYTFQTEFLPVAALLKIPLSSPTHLQNTCANVFPHFGGRGSS